MAETLTHRAESTAMFHYVDPDSDRFRLVFDAVNDGIFIAEKGTGRLIDVNEPGCRMFGYDRDELIGRKIGPLSSGEYPFTPALAMAHMSTTGACPARSFEWHCKTKQGELFWSDISMCATEVDRAPVVVAIVRDISWRKRQDARIDHMAHHDELTGLGNRKLFTATLKRALANPLRGDATLAIAFLNLDHFKDVNDMHGHVVGDGIVRLVAQRLTACARPDDTVFRLGGDEFAILLGDAGGTGDIDAVAERLLAGFARPFAIDGIEIQIGASMGMAIAGDNAVDPDTLLSHADTALCRAKAEGRQTHRLYCAELEDEVRSRVELTNELRLAIPAGQLLVVYQPQVTTSDGHIVGVEALVRWNHPSHGLLSPASFLPMAESSGVIVAIDRWVMREACRQARQWIDAGISPGTVCVNLSSAQFIRPLDIERFTLSVLEETGLPANQLELEITESTFIGFSAEHRDMMQRLRGAGVRFTLDDFGTGYSSLSYLHRIAIDRIKIPRDFIADISTSADAGAIVKCILNLARDLGTEVIAEGVETPDQARLLSEWDCCQAQGYYFAVPMTAAAVAPLLSGGKISR